MLFESVLLASWAGRAFRAAKEDRHAVEAMGISSQRLSIFLVLFSGMLVSMGAVFVIWQVQFLDPHYADLAFMVEVLTMGILALKPKVRSLALAVLFVVLVPEILRFFHLPSDVLGHLRTLLYAGTLMIFLYFLRDRLTFSKRFI